MGGGRFENVTAGAGDYVRSLHMGRGLACGDLDYDSDLDVVIVHHPAPIVILWIESPGHGNLLIVKLKRRSPNRDATGARLEAPVGTRTIVRPLDGAGRYISANDPRIHFGLGEARVVDRLNVRWPDGRFDSRTNVPVNALVESDQSEASSGVKP